MGIINLLDLQTANLIAAGEVVERAASVVKELCENSIDADAKSITIEIRNGGNTYIRVSDDGKGISEEDMPKTILRHATSKIKKGADLEEIATLGFRGEALAAISSVAKLTIISKRADSSIGNTLEANDIDGVYIKETGCPNGTTVIVRELFYNVPARRKFMKRDSTEAMAISTIAEKLAMSHPSISFRLISDRETKFVTSGDGQLLSAIYGVAGRSFASQLEEVSYEFEGMKLRGYISRPESARGTRSGQSFFINNRYIRSRTITAAIDEAFKSYIPSGRFPAAVLFIDTALSGVDVNVHPSKLEVRFSDEKNVFDTVYYGVLSALEKGFGPKHKIYEKEVPIKSFESYEMPKVIKEDSTTFAQKTVNHIPTESEIKDFTKLRERDVLESLPIESIQKTIFNEVNTDELISEGLLNNENAENADNSKHTKEQINLDIEQKDKVQFRFVGEIFSTYAVVELEEQIALIDKHAAHERILYESLKKSNEKHMQLLLSPLQILLSPEEKELLLESKDYLETFGFMFVEKDGSLFLDGIPQALTSIGGDLQSIIGVIVAELSVGGQIPVNIKADKALYVVACKAAVKAGRMLESIQIEWLAEQVLNDGGVRYCPHGRPVIQFFKKKNIAKIFDRN